MDFGDWEEVVDMTFTSSGSGSEEASDNVGETVDDALCCEECLGVSDLCCWGERRGKESKDFKLCCGDGDGDGDSESDVFDLTLCCGDGSEGDVDDLTLCRVDECGDGDEREATDFTLGCGDGDVDFTLCLGDEHSEGEDFTLCFADDCGDRDGETNDFLLLSFDSPSETGDLGLYFGEDVIDTGEYSDDAGETDDFTVRFVSGVGEVMAGTLSCLGECTQADWELRCGIGDVTT